MDRISQQHLSQMANRKIIGVIPARWESSRFPGKPLAMICGKPMIAWVYERCKLVEELSAVYVATDDERIYDACAEMGMEVIMTSTEHRTGTDRIGEVAKKVEGELFINIQGDEPLIEPQMIRDLIAAFADENVQYATLRKRIEDREEIEAPSTVKVVVDQNEDALYFSRSVIPSLARDERAAVYRHVGIYGYTREFLQTFVALPQTPLEKAESLEQLRALEHGYKLRVKKTQYDTIGVDMPEHIARVEQIMQNNQSNK